MEVMHSVHAHGPAACPVCGGAMKKAYAPPAIHFKGTGWARKERSSRPARRHAGSASSIDSSEGGSDSGASGAIEPAARKETD